MYDMAMALFIEGLRQAIWPNRRVNEDRQKALSVIERFSQTEIGREDLRQTALHAVGIWEKPLPQQEQEIDNLLKL